MGDRQKVRRQTEDEGTEVGGQTEDEGTDIR